MPSKSMPQHNNNNSMGTYPYDRVGALVSMHITDILTKNSCGRYLEYEKDIPWHKMIKVVDRWMGKRFQSFLLDIWLNSQLILLQVLSWSGILIIEAKCIKNSFIEKFHRKLTKALIFLEL